MSERLIAAPRPRPGIGWLGTALFLAAWGATGAAALPVEQFTLDNGMRFLLVRRAGLPMTSAAWAARAGSAHETPGRTGVSHLIEHLMFKGSRTIGVRDSEREQLLMARDEGLRSERRRLNEEAGPGADYRRRAEIDAELARLGAELRSLMIKGEYARVYTEAGAVGMNALTREDLTVFWAQLPANKLELWFWMESDRLLQPVLREFYSEFDVIDEERRRRIDSRPSGRERARFAERFWGPSHPYSWPAIGRSEDLRRITRPEAEAYFASHYGAADLAAVVVGDFEPDRVRRLARTYFGRLPGGAAAAPAAGDRAALPERRVVPRTEVRIDAPCRCPTQVEIRYLTVPFGHPDSGALDVLAAILSGRTGRLHRSLVLERGIAFSASAEHAALERAGTLSVFAEARGATTAADLEAACHAELERLQRVPVSARELQKVKNQSTADAYRRLRDPLALALRLLAYATLGDWRHLERWPEVVAEVSAEDVRRVARSYLTVDRRGVALLSRVGTGSESPAPDAESADRQ